MDRILKEISEHLSFSEPLVCGLTLVGIFAFGFYLGLAPLKLTKNWRKRKTRVAAPTRDLLS